MKGEKMEANMVIRVVGKRTFLYIDGHEIGRGVNDLKYSATDKEGNLHPTIQLLDIDVAGFKIKEIDKENSPLNLQDLIGDVDKLLGDKNEHN